MKHKAPARAARALFVLNALFLVWAILWKCGVPFIGDGTQRAINFLPFNGNTSWEMQLNVLLFVPYGFLLSAVTTMRLPWRILAVASTSALLEVAQYLLSVGQSDITDLLLNTAGGLIGIAACFLLKKLFGKRSHTAVMIAGVLIIAFEIYVSASLLLFGMVRFGFIMFRL